MKQYKSNKIVDATPMTSSKWMTYREDLKQGGYSDANLEPNLEGYMVVYDPCTEDEYWSWSPKKVFEDGYSEEVKTTNNISGMNRMSKFA
ncbi:MAG: hypothetical protein GY928_08525 [Colwellia sp.]|nr:hypothetical protein [Colwellia sp.]